MNTHMFIWFIEDNPRLNPSARAMIMDPECETFFSVASAWEMTIKSAQGKLDLGQPLSTLIQLQLKQNRTTLLPVTLQHLSVLATLAFHHRDPFDRLLISQSISEEMALLSVDAAFEPYEEAGLVLLR